MRIRVSTGKPLAAYDITGMAVDVTIHPNTYEVEIAFDYYKNPTITWFDKLIGVRWKRICHNAIMDRKTDMVSHVTFHLPIASGYSGLSSEYMETINSIRANIWTSRSNAGQVVMALHNNKVAIIEHVWSCVSKYTPMLR